MDTNIDNKEPTKEDAKIYELLQPTENYKPYTGQKRMSGRPKGAPDKNKNSIHRVKNFASVLTLDERLMLLCKIAKSSASKPAEIINAIKLITYLLADNKDKIAQTDDDVKNFVLKFDMSDIKDESDKEVEPLKEVKNTAEPTTTTTTTLKKEVKEEFTLNFLVDPNQIEEDEGIE
jgi:hypothetical protein